MTKLIKLLKQAHAIEIGAYHAYEGHQRNAKDLQESYRIGLIQLDESSHRMALRTMLYDFGEGPSKIQDAVLWLIGKLISLGCYIFPYKMAAWGAKIMETMGTNVYENLADQAIKDGQTVMAVKFLDMADQEKRHEEFFKRMLSN